jgi:hypothetical protein
VTRQTVSRCLAALLLAACGPVAAPPSTIPDAALPLGSGAALHSPSASTLPGLRADVARIAGQENIVRGDTLLGILRELGLDPEAHTFPNPRQRAEPRPEGRNLVVTLGSGPRDIVVGAHYDAFRLPDGRVTGGAVDNGAGAVILTRVAETLRGHDLRHRVRVVLFDLEEVGLLGSRSYLAAEAPDRIAAMVNVDIAAYGTTLLYGPTSHAGNDQVYLRFRVVCAVLVIPCLEFPLYPASDDRTFQSAGIPNVSIASLPAVEAHQFWLLLNAGGETGLDPGFKPATIGLIHTAADTVDHVDPTAMTLVHDAVVALVLELDRTL